MEQWDEMAGTMVLPDGRRIRGTGFGDARAGAPAPDIAVYLLADEPEPGAWPFLWVAWPDYGLPNSTEAAVSSLREAHRRAADERVEIACGAGLGRTGTALAVLAILSGIPPADAVSWVRANYNPRAIETEQQEQWVNRVGLILLDPR